MMKKNQQLSVFITGASTGIGHACAGYLAQRGFQVFAGVRQQADAEALSAHSKNIVPVFIDIANASSIQQAVQQIAENLSRETSLHGLVNNAGIVLAGPLEFLPLDDFRYQLEVNVTGHLAVTQAFLPLIRKSQGRIINMGSIAGMNALPFLGPYSISKHALESFTDALRQEVKPFGVDVSIIQPGSISTPIWEKSRQTAEALTTRLPGEMMDLYGEALNKVKTASIRSSNRGISTDYVARAVYHALTAPQPKTRYLIGQDAALRKLLSRLPDRLKDWIIAKKIGLPG